MKVENRTLLGKLLIHINLSMHACILLIVYRLKKYEIMMVLSHGQYYSVSLCEAKNSIQVDIILEQSMKRSAEHRKQLVDFFQTTLEKVCNDLIPASSKPVPYIQCPHCDNLHLKLRNLLEERAQLCGIKSVHPDYYQDLFRDFSCTYVTNHLCIVV